MLTVTVAGTHGHTVTLNYDSVANAAIAKQLAAVITAGVGDGSVIPAKDTKGPPPAVPSGKTGEWIQSQDGFTILPPGYKDVVVTAKESIIFGSGDPDESILSSTGNLNFYATGGSGTVAAGGGNNLISIPTTDKGSWSINTGNGDDVILALGKGNDTIHPGGGHNAITLGDGKDVLQLTGDDTVVAGSGHETIGAIGKTSELIYGNASSMFFVDTGGSATVFGGTGTDTFFGTTATGPELLYGGSHGDNYLMAGLGSATLFGGGDGDQLIAMGSKGQALHAADGHETLNGAFASGADTFYGSSGTTQMYAGLGHDTFVFTDGEGGGKSTIQGFSHGNDLVDLQGYGKNAVADALKSQHVSGGSDTITLTDGTKVTFANVTSLTASDFVTSSGGSSGGGSGGGGHGHHGHDGHDGDNHGHHRDSFFGHH